MMVPPMSRMTSRIGFNFAPGAAARAAPANPDMADATAIVFRDCRLDTRIVLPIPSGRTMRVSRRQSLKTIAVASAMSGLAGAARAAAPGAKLKPIRLVILDIGGTIIQDHGEVPNA